MSKPILRTVTIDWNGFIFEVTGEYEPGDDGLWTYSNGDPGYPPTNSNFYMETIELKQGELLDFALELEHHVSRSIVRPSFQEEIEELCIQKIEEN